MNKAVIFILAICLISVHAFVKRDAPETTAGTAGEKIMKDINETGTKIAEQIKQVFNPDTIQKNFNEIYNQASDLLNKLKPTEAPKA